MGSVRVSAALQDVLTVNAESDWPREVQMRRRCDMSQRCCLLRL